jgi:putative hydrolase of the HAD superfamily
MYSRYQTGSDGLIKAILFDLDDTIFDHRHAVLESLKDIQKEFGCFAKYSLEEFEAIHSEVLERIHLNDVLSGRMNIDEARAERFRLLFETAGQPVKNNEHWNASLSYRKRYMNTKRAVEGAEELLKGLHGKVKLAIVSNNLLSEQVPKLKEIGFEQYFDVLVTSAEAGIAKPDKRIFEIALGKLSVSPGEAVVIGDSFEKDVAGAYNAGIRSIWFNPRGKLPPSEQENGKLRPVMIRSFSGLNLKQIHKLTAELNP